MTPKYLRAFAGLVVPGVLALAGSAFADPTAQPTVTFTATGDASLVVEAAPGSGFTWRLNADKGVSPTDGRFQASIAGGAGDTWISGGRFALLNTTVELVSLTGQVTVYEDLAIEFGQNSATIVSSPGTDKAQRLFDLAVESSEFSRGASHLEYFGAASLTDEMAATVGHPELAGKRAGYLQLSADVLRPIDTPTRDPGDGGIEGGPGTEGGDIDIWCSAVGVNGGGAATASNFAYHGAVSGVSAFSTATTACTGPGNIHAEWFSVGTNQSRHPLIAGNVYRLLNGRFEQIGQNCVKHSFCAVDEFTCGTCAADGNCDYLAPGCADTYTASRNGSTNLGLRSNINPVGLGLSGAQAATHSHPFTSASGNATLRGRINIATADLANAGAQYLIEVQYVTHEEPLANRNNNCSYRRISTTATSFTGLAVTQAQKTAIQGWRDLDPTVVISNVDVPGEGRFEVAYKVTDNGDGTWHYEYAVHNQTSNRAAGQFSLPIPSGVNVTNIGFHDIGYHSGETIVGTDWAGTLSGGNLSWASETFAANPNANAIRWGTTYNFRFDADAPPTTGSGTLGLWRTGSPSSLNFTAAVPCVAGSFSQQPSPQNSCVGQPASFTIGFPGAISYKWRKNGIDLVDGGTISGALSPTLTISAVAAGDAASYDCRVSTTCGQPTSNPAVLTVNTAPAITGQPAGQNGQTGDTIVLTATSSGSPAPSFTWTHDSNAVANGPTGSGSTISGALTGTLTITNAQPTDSGLYVARASNSCGNAPSNAANVQIGCPGDFNNDGGVDGDDVIAFFGLWDMGDIGADFNHDDGVDGDDVIAFFGHWDAGC